MPNIFQPPGNTQQQDPMGYAAGGGGQQQPSGQSQQQAAISPYAQSFFGELAQGQQTQGPDGQGQQQQGSQGQQASMAGPMINPNFGPYLSFLGALPRAVRPNMQAPLAQMFANLIAQGGPSA